MPHRPELPDHFEIPQTVGQWTYDPESNKNGHVWYGPDRETAVGVFCPVNSVYVMVSDERCIGLERGDRIFEKEIADVEDRQAEKMRTVESAAEHAVDWMADNDPQDWSCERVHDCVLDAPAGYEVALYEVATRTSTVYYHRIGTDPECVLGQDTPPENITPETYPYIRVKVYRGSGNAEVALSPWTRAHDDQVAEIREPPEGCGVEVAVSMARQYVRDGHAQGGWRR
jgi:hypothetical protein